MCSTKATVFVITNLACNLSFSMFGTFSVIKQPMAQQFHFAEQFLGVADSLSFLFLLISGILIVLFPLKRVKLSFTILNCINGLFLTFVILASWMPSYAKLLIAIAMIGSGLAKCAIMFPYILVSQSYDPSTEAHFLNIWFALLGVGESIGFFLNRLMLDEWKLSWQVVFAIWLGLMCLFTLIQQAAVQEVEIGQEDDQRTTAEKLKEIKEFLVGFLKQPVHALLALDYMLEVSVIYNNPLWIAYFFRRVGFGSISPLIAMAFSIMTVPGLFGMEFLITHDCIKARYITVILLFLNALTYIAMVVVDLIPENSTLFLILFGLSGFFLGGPFSRTGASESTEVVRDNSRHKYIFLNFENALKNAFNTICLLVIGVTMEHIDVKFFLYIDLIVVVGAFGVHLARRVLEWREEAQRIEILSE